MQEQVDSAVIGMTQSLNNMRSVILQQQDQISKLTAENAKLKGQPETPHPPEVGPNHKK